jgi:PAS domain S-box-containing protein
MAKKIPSAKSKLKSKISDPQSLRVLIVEDSEDDALLAIRELKKGGYNLLYERVETAAAMRKALQDKTWDVILSDYKMPHFSGTKAIALLKETNIDIPFIIVSGAIGEETAVECMRLGAHDYIMKGDLSRLVPAMEREIAEAASRAERRRAEVALKESEMRYKLIFENMSSCVAIYETADDGEDFIIKDFNRSAEQVEKIGRKDTIGKSVLAVFPGVRDMGLWDILQRVWRSGQPEHFPNAYYKDARVEGWRENYVYKLPTGEVVALYNDITEHKKAEIRIFESEEKYRMLVENSSEIIFIAQDAKLKFVNKAALTMFGSSYEEMISIPFVEFIHPEDREMVLGSHLRRLRGEAVPSVYTFRIVTRERIIRWVEIHSTIIPWQGKPATLNFITDITERKLIEKRSLQKSRLLAAINKIFYETMTAESEKEVSQTCLNMALELTGSQFGFVGKINSEGLFSTTALSDPGWKACLIPETQATAMINNMVIRGIWGQVLLEGSSLIVNDPGSYPQRVGLPQGHPPITSFLGVPLKERNKIIGMIAVANRKSGYTDDLRQYLEALSVVFVESIRRKQAEEELKESENKYRLLADNVNDVIFVLDMNLNYTYVSPSVKILRGYEPAEAMKQPYFETLTPSSLDLAVRTLSEVMELEKSEYREIAISRTLQLEMRRKDGSTVWTEVKFSFIRDENQQPVSILGLTRDITERKQAESQREAALEALKKSEKKYRELYDFLPIPVYEMDFEANITSVNRAIYETFGGTEEDLQKGFKGWQLLSPEEVDKSAKNIQKLLNGEQVSGTEYNLMKLDGSVFPAIVISSVIYSDNKPVGLRGAVIDITERKRAEDKLRESEERYRALFDRSRDLVYITDFEGRFLDANEAALNRLGYMREEIRSLNFASLLSEDQLPLALKILPEIRETGIQKDLTEFRLRCKDGTYIYVETQGSSVLSNGAPVAIQAIARDITERRHAEEELKKSEEKYRSILENIEEGYYEVDLTGNFTFVNDSMCRIYGYLKEELLGLNYQRYFDKGTVEKMFRIFNEIYKTGKPSTEYSYELIRKDGVKRYIEASASLIKDATDRPTGFRGIVRDVTEHMEMEEAIRQSEERYRTIIEQMEDGYFEVDLAGKFAFVNDAECRNLGYSREEMIGMNNRQYSDKESQRKIFKAFSELYRTGVPIKAFEDVAVRKDGTIAINELSASLIRNSEGKAIGFRGIARDVTARKEMEEAIRQSEERYRTIIEQMEDGYFEIDLDGKFTFVNDAECRNLGYSREELIGKTSKLYADKEESEELFQVFRNIYDTGIPVKSYDLELVKKDGTKSYNEISAALIRDFEGNPVGFRGIARVVTERKKAEKALEDRMKQLTALSLASQAVAASLELDEVLKEVVSLAGEAVGSDYTSVALIDEEGNLSRSAENVPGLPALERRAREKGFTNWIMNSHQPVIIDEIGDDGSVISAMGPDESAVHFASLDLVKIGVRSLAGLPLLAKGRLLGVLYLHGLRSGAFHDQLALLTAFANQAAIGIENARLYEEVRHELASRRQTEEALRNSQTMVIQQEKMASIGLLAAGVAHEIKNPLAIMLQGVNYLQSIAGDDSMQQEVVARMHDAVVRADIIVKGLLSYARQDSIKLEDQNVETLIDDCLALTEHEFRKKKVQLVKQYVKDSVRVPMDINQIKQVFVNLIINGIDAMFQGGVMTICTRQITGGNGKNFLEITFKDTGEGISADQINKIFDPFYTTKSVGSTGLGLSISRGIIEKHGGTIRAESQIKQGTSMIIKLPMPT